MGGKEEEEDERTNRIPLPQMKVKETAKVKSQGMMKRMRGASIANGGKGRSARVESSGGGEKEDSRDCLGSTREAKSIKAEKKRM